MNANRWRIVMVQETGERVQYGDATYATSEDASVAIDRLDLDRLSPECHIYVEPDILTVGYLF